MLSNLLNGAASPANCARKIPGPLIVLIAPSTPRHRYCVFLRRAFFLAWHSHSWLCAEVVPPRRFTARRYSTHFPSQRKSLGAVARTINGETNLGGSACAALDFLPCLRRRRPTRPSNRSPCDFYQSPQKSPLDFSLFPSILNPVEKSVCPAWAC